MIAGNPLTIAIESTISIAYPRDSFLGLGFFAIHVGGLAYGVREPDATMLACSFGEIERRLGDRGTHTPFFSTEPDAGLIADAVLTSLFGEHERPSYLGASRASFIEASYSRHAIWAPDGDEAFDDESFVLQFDIEHRVRLIAFRRGAGDGYDPSTLRETWLEAEHFYDVLDQWRRGFLLEWATAPRPIE